MMIRWSSAAANDVEKIGHYLKKNNPSVARTTVLKLCNACESLSQFPNRGRIGREYGTREMVITTLPYIIVYQVTERAVHIARILHTAENWPES